MFKSSAPTKSEAEKAFAAQKYKRALELFLEVNQKQFDPKVSQRIGDIYRRLGDNLKANEEYRTLSKYYAREGFWAKAISVCRLALDCCPSDHASQRTLKELEQIKLGQAVPTSVDDIQDKAIPQEASDLVMLGNVVDFSDGEGIDASVSTLGAPLPPQGSLPLFSSLSSEAFLAVISKLECATYPQGAYIVEEGDLGESMFLISEGRVEVSVKTSDGEKLVLARLGGGEFFGEQSMLDRQPRAASVEAKTDTELLVLHRSHLESLALEYPSILSTLETFSRMRWLDTMLSRSTTFCTLSQDERTALAEKMTSRSIPAETILVEPGELGSEMYFIKQGYLDVYGLLDGAPVLLGTLGPSDYLGEYAMLTGKPRTARVKARSACELFVLTREAAASVLKGNVSVLQKLRETIQSRSKDLVETMETYREAKQTLGWV